MGHLSATCQFYIKRLYISIKHIKQLKYKWINHIRKSVVEFIDQIGLVFIDAFYFLHATS